MAHCRWLRLLLQKPICAPAQAAPGQGSNGKEAVPQIAALVSSPRTSQQYMPSLTVSFSSGRMTLLALLACIDACSERVYTSAGPPVGDQASDQP